MVVPNSMFYAKVRQFYFVDMTDTHPFECHPFLTLLAHTHTFSWFIFPLPVCAAPVCHIGCYNPHRFFEAHWGALWAMEELASRLRRMENAGSFWPKSSDVPIFPCLSEIMFNSPFLLVTRSGNLRVYEWRITMLNRSIIYFHGSWLRHVKLPVLQ